MGTDEWDELAKVLLVLNEVIEEFAHGDLGRRAATAEAGCVCPGRSLSGGLGHAEADLPFSVVIEGPGMVDRIVCLACANAMGKRVELGER